MVSTSRTEFLTARDIAVLLKSSIRHARDLLRAAEEQKLLVRYRVSPRKHLWDARDVDRWVAALALREQRDQEFRSRLLTGRSAPQQDLAERSPQTRRRRAQTPPLPLPAVPQAEN